MLALPLQQAEFMRVHWLQHANHEGLGCIAPWLASRGHTVTASRLQRGEALPALEDFDWLIAMGGPMNIYQHAQYPWLPAEIQLLGQAVAAGKGVLGMCLGAQLLAEALGAATTANPEPEVGFHPVHLTPQGMGHPLLAGFPEVFSPFHWHGDTFALPADAAHLMHSQACAHQAFAVSPKVIGLQFHLEVTAADAQRWFATEVPQPQTWVQTPEEILPALTHFAHNNQLMYQLLSTLEQSL